MINYNKYLKKYEKEYFVKRKADGVYEILCNPCKESSSVCNFSFPIKGGGNLLLYYFSGGKSARAQILLKKRIKDSNLWFQINQEGHFELTIIFREEDLQKFEKIFKLRKKNKISPETRQKRSDRMKKVREENIKWQR
jgi:hypothetical protein